MNKLVTPEKFNFKWLQAIKAQPRPKGNPSGKKAKYKDIITAFDIETTRIIEIEQSVMYLWQWQFGTSYTVLGRTWEQFKIFANKIKACMNDGEHLCTFVHNLSYEFQFLRGIYQFSKEEVFALKARKVLKVSMYDFLELRCSYIHSNMSLQEYTNKMMAKHVKLSGKKFDYTIIRYPWTKLKYKEVKYGVHDVLGLVEAITNEMQHDGDTLYTFPLTSTGYVRRDVKQSMRGCSHTYVSSQLPDYATYEMCREAFRGGDTHANRYYAGTVLHGIKSADRVSSYLDVICNCNFPTSQFFHAGGVTYEELLDLINVRKKAVIMRVTMTNVRLRDKFFGAPYLSRDKCRNMREPLYDNGRILEAEYLETTITDVDFKIILLQYDFDDFVPYDVRHARYGKLPKQITDEVKKYFRGKTELKNIKGQEIYYMKAKNKLNAIYGMMAQDPVKQTIDFIENEFIEQQEPEKELLTASNKKAFLCYQWGVWTTAHSRKRLQDGIQLAGDGFVYSDTDSVKYKSDIDWTLYNNERIKESKASGAYATDSKGKTHYMGVYEMETDELENGYYEFSTLGAKKYCYRETKNGELHITIAGVTKTDGAIELERAGGISAFKAGFIFREAGGTEAVYNDNPEIKEYTIDGHTIEIIANMVIRDSTYTLGITAEYERLLEVSQNGIDI